MQISVSRNKALWEHGHLPLFVGCQRLLSYWMARGEVVTETTWPTNLKCLSSGLLQEKSVQPCLETQQKSCYLFRKVI